MKLLAIDTATEACSAALLADGDIAERFAIAPRRHTHLILPMVDSLLQDAGLGLGDLDALAFGRGPGAFTGVRLAAGVVQGLALGADLPVLAVSDLAALAQGAIRIHGWPRVAACLDARMSEVYWGFYIADEQGLASAAGRDKVSAPELCRPPPDERWYGAGPGWAAYPQLRDGARTLAGLDAERLPSAADIALLAKSDFTAGKAVAAEVALPVYLRDEVAWKKP